MASKQLRFVGKAVSHLSRQQHMRMQSSRFCSVLHREQRDSGAMKQQSPVNVPKRWYGDPLREASAFSGSSANYIEQLFVSWNEDPASVHPSWAQYFSTYDDSLITGGNLFGAAARDGVTPAEFKELADHLHVMAMINAYRVRGHNIANLDPLGIKSADLNDSVPPELTLAFYGLTEADLDREFDVSSVVVSPMMTKGPMKLRDIIAGLEASYCGTVGVEYTHIPARVECDFIRERFETGSRKKFDKEEKRVILDNLTWAEMFEQFLDNKYSTEKRFGLEGGEALIPGMLAAMDRLSELGAESVVFGMPHRGRLNVLSNVVDKPFESIFSEFQGNYESNAEGSGDVKYHLGMSEKVKLPNGNTLSMSLCANPSHLETVNPVVLGKARAKQHFDGDTERKKVVSLLLHGDAAFSGQGVVYETNGFTDLPHYTTGGTIHIIVNNQIGFTTEPRFSRSTPYCTDVARAINAPIFHVNGDDVEAVVEVCKAAAEYRQQFNNDVVIDIVCYRRHGHNEQDQPSFTQPLMYKHIKDHPSTLQIYKDKLLGEKTITEAEYEEQLAAKQKRLEEAFEASTGYKARAGEWLASDWSGMLKPDEKSKNRNTGISRELWEKIGKSISTYPDDFKVHANLKRILKTRLESVKKGSGVDFGTAEGIAFGSLLLEGNHVRLSGQDVERGTFSHRHAVLHDQSNEDTYVPLNYIEDNQSEHFSVCNSSLSEYGVLGFEHGYSLENPKALVIWEAQFGDFVNGAQIMIDQFISAGEQKWLRQSGLVMLLPHGYEGQGPEHSSARLERFLMQCDEDYDFNWKDVDPEFNSQRQHINMQIVNCSTPANFFHVLRRQQHRSFRKPLIVFTPKSLLRHPLARSTYEDMAEDTRFVRLIPERFPEALNPPEQVRRQIFCSGKVYYDLLRAREENGVKDVAISTIEELAPFPFDKLSEAIAQYPNAEVVWCQEEPKNMGAWSHFAPRCENVIHSTPKYFGRAPSAATATGNKYQHIHELHLFLGEALLDTEEKPTSVENGVPIWQ